MVLSKPWWPRLQWGHRRPSTDTPGQVALIATPWMPEARRLQSPRVSRVGPGASGNTWRYSKSSQLGSQRGAPAPRGRRPGCSSHPQVYGTDPSKDHPVPAVRSSPPCSELRFLHVLLQAGLCTPEGRMVPWLSAGGLVLGGAAPAPHSLSCPGLNRHPPEKRSPRACVQEEGFRNPWVASCGQHRPRGPQGCFVGA